MWPFGDKVSDKKLSDLVTGSSASSSNYNPRMGQFGSSSGSSISDTIKRIREAIHGSTPNAFDYLGRVGSAAAPAMGMAGQNDILTNHKGFFSHQGNYEAANSDLHMTPQEQQLYQRHLTNLYGKGGVDNPDGSRSTVYASVTKHGDKYYNIPTVWDGKIETEKYTRPDGKVFDVPNATALANADKAGWDSFPSGADPEALAARYGQMHQYLDKDMEAYRNERGGAPPEDPAPTPASPSAPKLPWWASGDIAKMFPGGTDPQTTATAAPDPAPAGVPMPLSRPAEASASQPDTSWFMRNAMMMRDPATGELIDPQGAASVRGPDLISKMMGYLHQKV
jgi:hypothetical protein